MKTLAAPGREEVEKRQVRLLRLHHELKRLGVTVRVRKPHNGRWQLRVRRAGWTETVLCAGAEGDYAYVSVHGRLLGPVDDVRYVARLLVWMIERRER
ncbi:hypothetical protein [Spirillospora sp. NPDC047279]|uniref:hypothetical protein n=1 Tax=Spirillospora sp. NPDC047279 TaxID=3155478 RepID=UPI0033DBF48F